jgi:plastocyanin
LLPKSTGIFLLPLALLGAAHGQSFKGKIALSAVPKALAPHPVTRHQTVCGQQIPNEALTVGKKLELANVVAFVANLKPEAGLPHAVIPLDMKNCAFKPQVLAVLAGDTLWLRNHDAVAHDTRGEQHAFRAGWDSRVTKDLFQQESLTVFNFVFPTPEATAIAVLDRPGLVRVHSKSGDDWMQAFILVVPHRAFAISDEKGEFILPRLPRGKYDLILWHEHLGIKRQLIEIMGGKTTEALITWEIPEEMHATASK